uniref:hypothetical protein n=1 Tax=Actinomadura roseirufa TaxID=2094049 RepID=UPI0013F155D4
YYASDFTEAIALAEMSQQVNSRWSGPSWQRPWRSGPDGPDGASYYAAERTHWLGSRRAIDAVP